MVCCDMQTASDVHCQHTSVSECASCALIGPMSDLLCYLSVDAFGIRSFGAFGVASSCVTVVRHC